MSGSFIPTNPGGNQYRVDPPKVRAVAPKSGINLELDSVVAEGVGKKDEGSDAADTAIFVAHGMGQQITFQTLDLVAEGLRRQDPRWQTSAMPQPIVKAVKVEDELLTRIELPLLTPKGTTRWVHIYEGYWAPLTEGKVNLRDVVGFLFSTGINGAFNGSVSFKRWLFNEYVNFGSQVRTVMILLIALAAVTSLVVMNTVIALVVAAKSPLQTAPAWLTPALYADLTTTFNLLECVLFLFGLVLIVGKAGRRFMWPDNIRWGLTYVTLTLMFVGLAAIILAGLAIPLLINSHVVAAGAQDFVAEGSREIWPQIPGMSWVSQFNGIFSVVTSVLLGATGLIFLLVGIAKLVMGVISAGQNRAVTFLTALALAGIMSASVVEVYFFLMMSQSNESAGLVVTFASGISWPILVAISWFIRNILVQYLGDVAAYVTPHKLDQFNELRAKIRNCVLKAMRSVYVMKGPNESGLQYRRVFVVGHSLGAVVVYDALNRLINEDALSGNPLEIVQRTPLLTTFGAPLDKTAFLFALQKQQTSEAREALAAAVQPLIQGYDQRPKRWINIWSPADIISGSLEYYDPPPDQKLSHTRSAQAVRNIVDNAASTLLAAHLEYWNNPLLFRILYRRAVR